MRMAASCGQPLHVSVAPRGARTTRGSLVTASDMLHLLHRRRTQELADFRQVERAFTDQRRRGRDIVRHDPVVTLPRRDVLADPLVESDEWPLTRHATGQVACLG